MPIEPNPFDDARLAEIRAEQGDPIVQYYIVRTDLNMSPGKIAAQVAHGAQMFVFGFQRLQEPGGLDNVDEPANTAIPRIAKQLQLTQEWHDSSFRKVVLGGKKKDFEKIIKALPVFLVRDAGLTEVEPNSETVIVTWPMRKSEQPKVLSRLQTLK